MLRNRLLLLLALGAAACGGDTTGPASRKVQLAVLGGDVQFGLPGAELADPLQVIVHDAVTEDPVEDVKVTWRVVQGNGQVTSASSTTDVRGIASTRLRLGAQLGDYSVEARAERQVGEAVRFGARAVERPVIQSISPTAATAGQTVVITGANFSPQADYNTVRFDGVRGQVTSASATRLEVVVPACVPSRTVTVQVLLGPVASSGTPLATVGTPGTPLALEPGQARTFVDGADLACVRLAGGLPSARYLLIPQNVATVYTADMPFELAAFAGGAPVTFRPEPLAPLASADAFELRLRSRERALVRAGAELRRELRLQPAVQADPQVGDRRSFKVLNADEEAVTITAEVKVVSTRAVIYQDLEAPAGGFTAQDFANFGTIFDGPIYGTDVAAFGQPTDIDANGRIIILFTPRINALTRRGDQSYIAGYFYGCDLVSKSRCPETNSGEIFYAFVPDPQAKFGDARATSLVLRSVLPVLAHELQHMINFGQRDETLDALWLSEALAHTAEELVGRRIAASGDPATGRDFTRSNLIRAARFLGQVSNTSMIAEEPPGTLELRGAGWLFVRYLRAHYGGDELLRKLTATTLSSSRNVTAQTGQPWSKLLADFAVALYASEAAELAGVALAPQFTFGSLPVRAELVAEIGSWPLQVGLLTFGDASVADELPSSSTAYYQLNAPPTSTYPPTNLVFSGRRGGPFASAGIPQLTIFRAR